MTTVIDHPVASHTLGDNDYVLGSTEARPSISSTPTPWGMSVNFHLRTETPVVACAYDDENRITVSLGGTADDLTLFLPADQLDRLITVLRAARERLS
jgi:hypothetical protein